MVFLEGNFNFATIFGGPPGGPTGMVESSLTWVVGIQFCTNEEPHPFGRGDNELAKIH